MSGAAEILDWIYSKLGTGFLPCGISEVSPGSLVGCPQALLSQFRLPGSNP